MWFRIGLVVGLVLLSFVWGRGVCQTKVLTKRVEVVRYVQKQSAKIVAAPNVGKSDILELLRAGRL